MARSSDPRSADFEIKVVGKSGQISLGKRFAGKVLRLDRLEDGSILLTAVAIVPESQLWTVAEPDRSSIARGLAWAEVAPARVSDFESLAAKRPKSKWSQQFVDLAGSAAEFPYPEEPSAAEPGPELE